MTRPTLPTCRAHYPDGPDRCACRLLPRLRGLPRNSGGSASATSLARPAQASLTLRPVRLLDRPRRLARVAEGLGVDAPITAEFYKLLLYDEGSFFVGHRDTEKAPGMFATLVVALPSSFAGGELVVRHKGREVRLDLRCDDPAEAAFAAFYAD